MRDITRLEVLERASELAELTYRATATLPESERDNLIDQLQRAAISVGSNIAEGCGRSTDRAYLNYLQHALSSVGEVEYQAGVAIRLRLGDRGALQRVRAMARRVKMMLAKLMSAVRRRGKR